MKILWICNVATPAAAKALNMVETVSVSWLVGMSEAIKETVELCVAIPTNTFQERKQVLADGILYIAIPRKSKNGIWYEKNIEKCIKEIIENEKPDCIHIWGTEFPHVLSAVKACQSCGVLEQTVISIQGLVSVIAKHYFQGLPQKVIHALTFRDLVKCNNIYQQKHQFERRGYYEQKALSLCGNVIGRTDWDHACVELMNPNIHYFHNNETLRDEFYQEKWQYETCQKHRIFISSAGYPVKGFHYAIEALRILMEEYPDLEVCIPGNDIFDQSFLHKIRETSYIRYIRKCICKYNLRNKIIFLGVLDARQMCEQYKLANVFVSASVIENSPNSLGEAMILGTPVVASDVGGVRNMLVDKQEGFLYPQDEPYMLAYYIKIIFEMGAGVTELTQNARKHALITHDRKKNQEDLLRIYNCIKKK